MFSQSINFKLSSVLLPLVEHTIIQYHKYLPPTRHYQHGDWNLSVHMLYTKSIPRCRNPLSELLLRTVAPSAKCEQVFWQRNGLREPLAPPALLSMVERPDVKRRILFHLKSSVLCNLNLFFWSIVLNLILLLQELHFPPPRRELNRIKEYMTMASRLYQTLYQVWEVVYVFCTKPSWILFLTHLGTSRWEEDCTAACLTTPSLC